MPTLQLTTYNIIGSNLGEANPLPDLHEKTHPPGHIEIGPEMPPEQSEQLKEETVRGCLPYRVQDGYDCKEIEQKLNVAVLENEHLKAVFLLELGGRLWSLVDKTTGRELLYQPKVLHYANVALRNAWFCGGVEWNIGVRGHTAHTCAPLFAARIEADDGPPVLRLYEWDRFRGLLFQIDFILPEGARMLIARPRVMNPNGQWTRMYWWSNIAVQEAEGHRVVVPAESAYHFGYRGRMEETAIPIRDGVDTSYPTRIPSAHDYFYSIPPASRPWIASLDADGRGLIHASTYRLKGRKLFVWGMGPGGRRWQSHLGGRGGGYIEIQAGLGRTQMEYLPMPPDATSEWLEAYMPIAADPKFVHGENWASAYQHVQKEIDALAPQATLEKTLGETASTADRPPAELLWRGSGWGALEQRRREADGEGPLSPPSMTFDEDTLTHDQTPWLTLLKEGALPYQSPAEAPGAWIVSSRWRRRLDDALAARKGDHWCSWLHLGVMAYYAGDFAHAVQAWKTSLDREPSAWAYRNLAVAAQQQDRADEAADLYLHAAKLAPSVVPLQTECCRQLTDAGRLDDLDKWVEVLPTSVRHIGRIGLAAGWAALRRGDFAIVDAILADIELPDIREGETSLTDLWFAMHEARIARQEGAAIDDTLKQRVRRELPPPRRLDYRMSYTGQD